jgi:hypothetical protein
MIIIIFTLCFSHALGGFLPCAKEDKTREHWHLLFSSIIIQKYSYVSEMVLIESSFVETINQLLIMKSEEIQSLPILSMISST